MRVRKIRLASLIDEYIADRNVNHFKHSDRAANASPNNYNGRFSPKHDNSSVDSPQDSNTNTNYDQSHSKSFLINSNDNKPTIKPNSPSNTRREVAGLGSNSCWCSWCKNKSHNTDACYKKPGDWEENHSSSGGLQPSRWRSFLKQTNKSCFSGWCSHGHSIT